MFKHIFIIAVFVVGAVEWIKKLLPQKALESKALLATISGVISVIGSVLFVAFAQTLGFVDKLDNAYWVNYVLYAVSTVCMVQVNYTALFKTLKAVGEKLKSKYANSTSIDEDKLSDEIVNTVGEKVTEVLSEAVKTTSKKK